MVHRWQNAPPFNGFRDNVDVDFVAVHNAYGGINECPINLEWLQLFGLRVSLSHGDFMTILCKEGSFKGLCALRPKAKGVPRTVENYDPAVIQSILHRRLRVDPQRTWRFCLFNSHYHVQMARVRQEVYGGALSRVTADNPTRLNATCRVLIRRTIARLRHSRLATSSVRFFRFRSIPRSGLRFLLFAIGISHVVLGTSGTSRRCVTFQELHGERNTICFYYCSLSYVRPRRVDSQGEFSNAVFCHPPCLHVRANNGRQRRSWCRVFRSLDGLLL